MRISELSSQTGIPLPTIKYYLREKLIPEGERTSPTQARYGEHHVKRLNVIRALVDAGVSIAGIRTVLDTLDDPTVPLYDLLAPAHTSVSLPGDPTLDLTSTEQLVRRMGWDPETCGNDVLQPVARALNTLERADFVVPEEVMDVYLRSVREIADAEVAATPTTSPEAAVTYVVLGSVLVEPLLLALRRVAEQVASAERFNGSPHRPH